MSSEAASPVHEVPTIPHEALTSRVRRSAVRLTQQRCQMALRTLSSLGVGDDRREGRVDLEETVAENLAPAVAVDADPATIAATMLSLLARPSPRSASIHNICRRTSSTGRQGFQPCWSAAWRSFMISWIIGGSSVALAYRNPILPAIALAVRRKGCRPSRTRSQRA